MLRHGFWISYGSRRALYTRPILRCPSIRFASKLSKLSPSTQKPPPSESSTTAQPSSILSRSCTWFLALPSIQKILHVGPLRVVYSVIGAFLFWHIATSYFFTFSLTWGISMLPTLNSSGDWVLISKYYRRGRGVQVGDLVSFLHPVDEGTQAIKRVVGLEGDFVGMGPAFVGEKGKSVGGERGGMMIQVPQGHCWVVGDNVKHSRDSRLYGPLPLALIKGKIVARYSPWFSLQWIKNGLEAAADQDEVE